MILDDDDSDEADAGDETEGASGDVDTGHIEWDASPHNTFAISELASASHATQDPGDQRAPFSTAWGTSPAACWTPDKDNPVPSRMGRTSKQV
jgi:hypothetical protein